jgi:hypothetical protein
MCIEDSNIYNKHFDSTISGIIIITVTATGSSPGGSGKR